MKKKILVLGASSHIGPYILKEIGAKEGIGTYHSHPFPGGVRFDIQSDTLETDLDFLPSVSHAIILLGITDMELCATDKPFTERINVILMKRLIDHLIQHDIHITYASTDLVFDGTKGKYTELDLPNPILSYAKQKYAIEQYITSHTKKYIIARFGKAYGSVPHDHTLITLWIDQLREGKPITVSTDQRFSPIRFEDIAIAIKRLIDINKKGIYHIAGPEDFSRKELFDLVVQKLKQRIPLDVRVAYQSIDDFNLADRRPHNVTLSIDKLLKEIAFNPKRPDEAIDTIVDHYTV